MDNYRKVVAALPGMVRPYLEARLPDWLEPRWITSRDEAHAFGPGAEIGWFDLRHKGAMMDAITNASDMRWLNSMIAGMDGWPLETLRERQVVVTNGAGLNAITIAEYVLMGMLTVAKGYRAIAQAQDRHEWLDKAPGTVELYGSKALLLGYGAIGQLVAQRLKAFEVEVVPVRRTPDVAGRILGPDQWRARLGEFDWVILAVPATAQTERLIGAAELAAMKGSAVLLNVARGSIVDQDALVDALKEKRIAAAFLDVTDPEPLPADHPLWALDNAHITMHLSGRAQTRMFQRGAERFLENLARYRAGEPLLHQVDLVQGY